MNQTKNQAFLRGLAIPSVFVASLLFLTPNVFASMALGPGAGGGGGTLPAEPVGENFILNTIKISKGVIGASMNRMLRQDFEYPYFKKLFPETGNDIYSVLPLVQIEVNQTTPCRDFQNNPVDGSINTGKANTICISLFNLKQKLSMATYQAEIPALIAHEISHLLGTSEVEAVAIQKYEFEQFMQLTPFDSDDWLTSMNYLATSYAASIGDISNRLIASQPVSCSELEALAQNMTPVRNQSVAQPDPYSFHFEGGQFYLLRIRDSWYAEQVAFRMAAARDFWCSQQSGPKGEVYAQQFKLGLNGQNEVSIETYLKNTTGKDIPFGVSAEVIVGAWIGPANLAMALDETVINLKQVAAATSKQAREFVLIMQ